MAEMSMTINGLGDDELEAMMLQLAGSTLLMAIDTLRNDGATVNEAFRLGSYFALVQLYGRKFVRDEFGVQERTEQLWQKRIRAAQLSLGGEPSQEMIARHIRAAVAFAKNREAAAEESKG